MVKTNDTSSTEDTKPIDLPNHLDIKTVTDFQSSLSDHLETGATDYLFNGSDVERITTPSIQLLIAFERAAMTQNATMQLTEPSAALRDAFATLGLSEQLTQWERQNA